MLSSKIFLESYQFFLKGRKIILNDIPDELKVSTKVLVDKPVSHALDQIPWYLRRSFSYLSLNMGNSLADHLSVIQASLNDHEIA